MSGYTEVGSIEPDPMIERIILLKQEAYVYKIPPAQVSINLITALILLCTYLQCMYRYILHTIYLGPS